MNYELHQLLSERTDEYYNHLRQDIFTSDAPLATEDERALAHNLDRIEDVINQLQQLKLRLGQLYDYHTLKKQGYDREQLTAFEREDQAFIQEVETRYSRNHEKRDYMFGYPANLQEYSYVAQYFRTIESKLYLMNNCGDPYQNGNYGMDSKAIERRLIALVAENFGLREEDVWGYITSGGTESNFWAIREGFRCFPKGKLYFSKDTHYSVEKYVSNDKMRIYNYEVVPSLPSGAIDAEALKATILSDRDQGVEGAVLVLNWGTTCTGGTDDIKAIVEFLRKQKIPYYCHVDAALYGGIASNQTDAPNLPDLKNYHVHSISVSMHKFFGSARVNGVLLSLKSKGGRKVVDYIGQEDSTLLGSRDYLPFSMYQRVKELTKRCPPDTYSRQIDYFKNKLTERGIPFEHNPTSNIFVIDKPSEGACLKYQLATFVNGAGEDKAHILIFPFHKRKIMDELVNDLSADM